MTVAVDPVRDFTRGQILRRALRKAGVIGAGVNPASTDPRVLEAADFLELVLASLQNGNVIITTTEFATLALVASSGSYTLPEDTLDVLGTAMVLQSAGGAELPVEPMGADEWQRITDKNGDGVPRRYYVHKLLEVQLFLWPVVDAGATGWTLRYRRERLLRGATSQTNTMDLRRSWGLYLVTAVAAQLAVANAMPVERIRELRGEAKVLKDENLMGNRARGPAQMHSTHRGPRWR